MSPFAAEIVDRRRVALDTLEVSFTRPRGLRFTAGQYLQLALTQPRYPDHRGPSRVFSIASSPNTEDRVTVAFRQSSSGYKRSLEEADLGSELLVAGPYGFLTLRSEPRRPLVLVAVGMGITPHLSMIRFAAEEGFSTPITLLYLNRTRTRAAYADELEHLAARSPSLTLRILQTELDERVVRTMMSSNPDAVWSLTGPPIVVERLREALLGCGIDEDLVCVEGFIGY